THGVKGSHMRLMTAPPLSRVSALLDFAGQSHTVEEMRTNALGEVGATPRAHVCAASEAVRRKVRHFIVAVAERAVRDEMNGAVNLSRADPTEAMPRRVTSREEAHSRWSS